MKKKLCTESVESKVRFPFPGSIPKSEVVCTDVESKVQFLFRRST